MQQGAKYGNETWQNEKAKKVQWLRMHENGTTEKLKMENESTALENNH